MFWFQSMFIFFMLLDLKERVHCFRETYQPMFFHGVSAEIPIFSGGNVTPLVDFRAGSLMDADWMYLGTELMRKSNISKMLDVEGLMSEGFLESPITETKSEDFDEILSRHKMDDTPSTPNMTNFSKLMSFCFTAHLDLQDTNKIRTRISQTVVRLNKTFLQVGALQDPPLILIFTMRENNWSELSNMTRISELVQVALEDTLISITEAFSGFHEQVSMHQRFPNTSIVSVVEFCTVPVDDCLGKQENLGALLTLLQSYLMSLRYKVPGVSLLPTSISLFGQLAGAYQMFGCPFLTPRSIYSNSSLQVYPNVLSFAPLGTDQAYLLVDLCRFMRWHRVVLVGTLGVESLHLTATLLREATSRHISVHVIRGNFGFEAERNMSCFAPASEIEAMAKSLSVSFSALDYSVFLFTVDSLCFLHVLTALRMSRLDTRQRVALIFSDTASQLFPIAQRYLHGSVKSFNEKTEVLEGWFFLLPGSPQAWCLGNMALQHRLNRDKSTSLPFSSTDSVILGLYEMLFYDVTRLVSQHVILQSSAFLDIHCLPSQFFFEGLFDQRTTQDLDEQYMMMQYKIIHHQRTVYDPYCFIKPFLLTVKNGSTVLPLVRPSVNSRQTDWPRFNSLMGSIVISPHGTDVSRFALFNIGLPSNQKTQWTPASAQLEARVIAVWESDMLFENRTLLGHRNSLARDLFFQGDVLLSRLHESVFFASYDINGVQRTFGNNSMELLISHIQDGLPLRPLVQVEFPGSATRVKDCFFCDKKNHIVSVVLCPICEEDRLQLHALLLYLMHRNPDLFNHRSYMKNTTLVSHFIPTFRPTELSVCELWPLIIRCSSPLTYVLYLEGLDLRGPLPAHIGRLKHLEELRLSRNYFEGPLPFFSPNLCRPGLPGLPYLVNVLRPSMVESMEVNKLKRVYLSRNLFNGTIPDDWRYCTALRVLYINDNQLHGPLPEALCQIQTLTDVDISKNQFSNSLPLCIGTSKEETWNVTNHSGWENLIHFNLENNKFEGGIPSSFQSLNRLMTLKMSNNNFGGILPDIWDAMPPGFLLDIRQNPLFHAPLPPSLIRRVIFRPENIWMDPFLYECRSGHFAPVGSVFPNTSLIHQVEAKELPLKNLSFLCVPCPKGHVVTQDARGCVPCAAGSVARTQASSECVKCAPGTYSLQGSDHCVLCRPGEYSYLEGSTMCHPCPANHYANRFGSSFCTMCPSGANCSTSQQKAFPEAAVGWYRVDPTPARGMRSDSLTELPDVSDVYRLSEHGISRELSERLIFSGLNASFSLPTNLKYYGQTDVEVRKQLGLYECPKPSHCLGNNTCLNLSFGPYCHQCQARYRLVAWRATCQPCPTGIFFWFRFLGVLFLALVCLVFVFYVLRSTGQHQQLNHRDDAFVKIYKNKLVVGFSQHHAVVLKVLTSWVELNGQALSYAIQAALQNAGPNGANVSFYVELVYDFIQNLDDPFFLLFPLECILPIWAPNPLHCSLLVALFAPIFFFFFIALWQYRNYWCFQIYCFFQRQVPGEPVLRFFPKTSLGSFYKMSPYSPKQTLPQTDSRGFHETQDSTQRATEFSDPWANTVGVFTVLFFLIHPAITRQFLKNLNCVQVDVPRVKQNYSLVCTTLPHQRYIFLAWIGLFAWTFGLPLFFLFNLHHQRHHLQDPKVLAQWGFILDGYENRYYWWEIWAMLRKVLLDIPPVIPSLTAHLQHLAMLSLAVVCLVAHVSAEPFDNRFYKVADHMEAYNLWTFLLTLLTVPVHEALNSPKASLRCQALSKLCLTLTFLASIAFLVWCFLFFLRPFLQSYFYRHVLGRPPCLASQQQLFLRRNSLRKQEFQHKSKSSTWLHPIQQSPLSSVPQTSTVLFNLTPTANSQEETLLQFNQEKELRNSRLMMVLGKTSSCQIFHQVMHHFLTTKLGRTVLRFHPAKVYLTYPDYRLDLSELSSTEKIFFQDVLIQDLLQAQYRLHPHLLDTHFVCLSLARIFRLKAFSLRVDYVKVALSRFVTKATKEDIPPWSRSLSKESFKYLKSLKSAFHTTKPFSFARALSLHRGITQASICLQNINKYPSLPCDVCACTTDMVSTSQQQFELRQISEFQTPDMYALRRSHHVSSCANQDTLVEEAKPFSSLSPQSIENGDSINVCRNTKEYSKNSLHNGSDAQFSIRKFCKDEFIELSPSRKHSIDQCNKQRWKQAKKKILWYLRFCRALETFPAWFSREGTQYGWTIEELQECVNHLTLSIMSRHCQN